MTILFTPFLFWPISFYLNQNSLFNFNDLFPVAIATMFASCMLSLPTFLILYICSYKLNRENCSEKVMRHLTAAISILGVIITFSILDFSVFFSLKSILFPSSYILILCFSSYFFKQLIMMKKHTIIKKTIMAITVF